ncbi:MAG: DUF4406 domain-containing protein [Treponemataceae bacterium]|nr:DUF4406 domain-containing protein [Treponemataceae bacterium]
MHCGGEDISAEPPIGRFNRADKKDKPLPYEGDGRKVAYLSGAITLTPLNYKNDFARAERYVGNLGYIVLNPAVLPQGMAHGKYLPINDAMIGACDAVFLQRDWRDSEGRGWNGNARPTTRRESSMRTNRRGTTALLKGKGKRHGLTRTRCTANDMPEERKTTMISGIRKVYKIDGTDMEFTTHGAAMKHLAFHGRRASLRSVRKAHTACRTP